MNKIEAQNILGEELLPFRDKSYDELRKLMGSPTVIERNSENGVTYIIEVEVFWDDPKQTGGNLRVLGSIDDGNFLSALQPFTSEFIMDPDGNFIGE